MQSTMKRQRRSQHGVYAMEWAIVFPVFFMLVYACVSYGLTFLVRQSMQNAVEDGARAALQYQEQRLDRLSFASLVAKERLSWLPNGLTPVIDVSVCRVGSAQSCATSTPCSSQWASRCLVRVEASLAYGLAPLAPPLPGLGVLVPDVLTASASMLVDPGGF